MTIAVTATPGALGAAVIRQLRVMTETPVIGLARTPSKAQGLGVEIRPGDYNSPLQFETSLQGVDTLLLIPGRDAPDARIPQHRGVIQAAKAAGVRKIVYASIQGLEEGTAFSPVVVSNRQTEADIAASGLTWAVGRNGIYIEPDVAYIDTYRKQGEIANCAGQGRCGYTTRNELALAFVRLLTGSTFDGKAADLHGTPITQGELAGYLNRAFGSDLTYREMTTEDYVADRTAELGPLYGPIIAGIYDGIRQGVFHKPGDFEAVAGRPHQSWETYFGELQP
ncbi:NAD(P)H-binding protein [Sedimentitalea sp.]|uniref:NAD(P)H-binding protein n=1 Tax=Sedimentitalea sp. TaxID=2048915 RepID=UPI00329A0D21